MVVIPVPDQPEIHIDTSLIPQFQKVALAKAAIQLVKEVFSIPGEEERYQEWLAHYEQEEKRDNI